MRAIHSFRSPLLLLWLMGAAWLCAADLDEFKIKREEVFEFVEKPRVSRAGDRVEITFEAKGRCDVTVAIEDGAGKIVRHLASGVLGPRAPEPFQKNSLKQNVVWDGKDDQGKYIDAKDALSVRVSLGLKPLLERTLLWDPRRRLSRGGSQAADTYPAPIMAATEEGVYVYDGGGTALDYVRHYDHEGNYVRSVYPFPADRVKDVKGLLWYTYPQDEQRLPLKGTFLQNTLLTSGDNWVQTFNEKKQVFHTNGGKESAHFGMWGHAATALAVRGGRLALAHWRLNRIATDGSSGGMELRGPKTGFPVVLGMTYAGPGGPLDVPPRSAALSPDGKWVYLAGYLYHKNLLFDGLHGVVRAPMDGTGESEVFAGSMKPGDCGSDAARFRYATCVAVDAQGRIYVGDYMNDRIQVFDAERRLLKSIPAKKPAHLEIHARTGALYVFSWNITNSQLMKEAYALKEKQQKMLIPATLSVLGSYEDPALRESYALPFEGYSEQGSTYYATHEGLPYRVCLDSWTTPPTLWMIACAPGRAGDEKSGGEKSAIRMLVPKDGKLVVKRDFGREAKQWAPVQDGRQRLFVNPATGKLYADPEGRLFGSLWEIDPASGKFQKLALPLIAEDMAFDSAGYAYLRTFTEVVRYDSSNWRQVPFDYGEERTIEGSGKSTELISCLPLPATPWFHHGGMGLSPKGDLAVGCLYASEAERRDAEKKVSGGGKPYLPKLYPGRTTSYNYGAIYAHVWDKHGRLRYEDAVPGLGGTHGLAIDNADNLYVMAAAARVLDGTPYFNDATGTLIKFKPQAGRLVCTAKQVPVPLTDETRPKRPPELSVLPGPGWVDGAEWMYGGVGNDGKKWVGCSCWNARFALDYFGRVFAPEIDRFKIAVLDTNGNLILRVGSYGNVDDGKPLDPAGGPPNCRALGGDEVSLMHGAYVATHSDRRLFIADPGNARIVSVKLGYHAQESVALKAVKDEGKR